MRKSGLLLVCLLAAVSVASIPDGAELLIVAADSIVEDGALQPLVDWKTHKGILTRIVSRTEAGSTTEGITAYIRAAYQAWQPRPGYVLLVGDPSPAGALHLPACFDQYSDIYTDCLYGDVDDASTPDYKMEISVGRLPVTTHYEARTAAAKVLDYEMANAGTDSLWFISGCTVVREDGDEDDSLYWSDSRVAHAHWQTNAYAPGDSLSRIRDHNADDVDSVASDGRAFIAYRGQTWGFNWGDPFRTVEPESWTNGHRMPVMVGGTCWTVNLWSATPAIGNRSVLTGTQESLGGAIAYFGTTDAGSQSELPLFRSAVYRGFFSAVFDERTFRLGPATLIARDSTFSLSEWRPRYLEWNLLGDPTLCAWVGGVPKPAVLGDLPDNHELFVGYDQPLGVTAISTAGGVLVGALVCAYKPGDVYVTGRTDSTGHAVLVVRPTTTGPLYLCVTEGHVADSLGAVGGPMLPCFDTLDCIEYVPWKERRYMPSDPSGKAVSSGGWLTYDAGDGQVYAAKGHGVADFYRYDPAQDSWHQLWAVQRGREGKLPKKGCRGASSGDGSVYMVKGNNTTGFWRYDAAENDWHQLPDVPLGPSRKRVMVGADMVFVSKGESSFVYLLKGRGCEFWRYSTADSSWGSLPNAPLGSHPKWNEGSWLAFDGAQTIYALKAKYHEFWRFDVSGDTWYSQSLPAMPFGPAGKKTKDGGSACFRNDMVYALKGGKTQELWMYDPVADEWEQRDTIPSRDSSSLRKTVKGGGDIVLAGDEILALKGNNTRALWQYWPRPSDGAFARRDGPPTRGVDGAETGLAEGMSALTPRWNEQGTAVVYVREAEDGVGAGYDQVYLVRASAPGTEVRVVDIAMDCSEPVFRPSGSHICFVLDDTVTDRLQIATVPVPDADFAREQQEKTEERAVTNDGAGTGTEQKESSVRLTRPVQLSVSGGRDRVVVPGLYAAGLPGAQAWGPQTPTLLTDDEWDHLSPSYSPSSGLICYCKDDATDRSQLYLISSGGGTEQALTDYPDADCESPSFLDNDHVTFIYSKDGEYDRVGKLNINSQQLTILTEGEYDAETPDPAKGGQSIAFSAQDNDGTYQVGLVRSDGTDERLVTSSSLDLEEPDWSGDGYSIAAVRWFGLASQIGMVDTASGDFTRLTDSSCIRDKPDVYYNQPAGISFVVYEREDPNATDGIRPKPRRRPGTGIFLVRHKKKQDGVMGAGLATELRRALPNPASGPVTVYWQVAQAGTDATVKVYDASGRQVRVLFSGKAKPGLNEATWTCRDQKGRTVPNGVYFCTLETKDDRISRKLILAAGE